MITLWLTSLKYMLQYLSAILKKALCMFCPSTVRRKWLALWLIRIKIRGNYPFTVALIWTQQLALKGSDTLCSRFGKQATLHSNGCQVRGKLHSHVSWQQVVPLWEKPWRWGKAAGSVVPQSWQKSHPPWRLKDGSCMISSFAHLFSHIFYPFQCCYWKQPDMLKSISQHCE